MFLLLIHTYLYIIFIYAYRKPLCDFMPVKGAVQISFKIHHYANLALSVPLRYVKGQVCALEYIHI